MHTPNESPLADFSVANLIHTLSHFVHFTANSLPSNILAWTAKRFPSSSTFLDTAWSKSPRARLAKRSSILREQHCLPLSLGHIRRSFPKKQNTVRYHQIESRTCLNTTPCRVIHLKQNEEITEKTTYIFMKHSSVGMALTNAYHQRPMEEPRFLSAFSISTRFSLLNTTVLDQNQQKSKRTQRASTRTWPLSLYYQNLRNVMNCRRPSKPLPRPRALVRVGSNHYLRSILKQVLKVKQ